MFTTLTCMALSQILEHDVLYIQILNKIASNIQKYNPNAKKS